jgi:hypothetical protein
LFVICGEIKYYNFRFRNMQKLFYSEEEEVDLNMLTPTIMTHSSFPKTNRSGKFIGGGRDERISIYVMMKAYN